MSETVEMTLDEGMEDMVSSPTPLESESSSAEVIIGKSSSAEQSIRSLPKKIKHPSSAWMIFSTENREKIQKEQPSLNFTEVARSLAEKYRNVTTEEKERLEGLAKADKERYAREMLHAKSTEIISADDLSGSMRQTASADLLIPLGRVRKILKLDSDVKNISKEAIVAITKATELFVAYMSLRCANTVIQKGARTVRDTDLVHSVHALDTLDFLRLDFPKIPKQVAAPKEKKVVRTFVPQATSGSNIMKYFDANSTSTSTSSMGNVIPNNTIQINSVENTVISKDENGEEMVVEEEIVKMAEIEPNMDVSPELQ